MRYFRDYPLFLQIVLFLLMTFTFISATWAILFLVVPKFSGYSITQLPSINEHSPIGLVRTALFVQGVGSISIFMLPAFLFAYLTHPLPKQYLGLRAPGKPIQVLLAITLMVGAMPVLSGIADLFSHMDLGAAVKESQKQNDNMTKAFLNVPDFASLLGRLFVIALIPAVGEELFFRGILLRLAKKRSNSMVFPILFTAAVFSYSHSNINGYLSIFLAGVLLAVIYNLTGSLWCSIVAHLFFNGSQVVMSYLGNNNAAMKAYMTTDAVPVYLVIGGAALFGLSLYLLLKNKTPLSPDWANDFDTKLETGI
jgi:membrane protease YdiL (CAAX protease family)